MLPTSIGKKAQVLAAALVLGTAVLGFAPGEALAEINEDQALCTQTLRNGTIVFHLPGEMMFTYGGDVYTCNLLGEWVPMGTSSFDNPAEVKRQNDIRNGRGGKSSGGRGGRSGRGGVTVQETRR